MLKREELSDPKSCLNKAEPSEPLFVIRAMDPMGPQTIRHWATMAQGHHEVEKITGALRIAEEMEKWRRARASETTAVAVAGEHG